MGRQQLAGPRPGPRRPSPAVYRRRRLVAGILAVLLLVGLGFAVAGVIGALTPEKQAVADATVPSPVLTAPAATPAAETKAPKAPKPAATPSESACPAESVLVTAATDAQVYPAGATPILALTVTNTGESACEINVGTSQMEFSVASGSDRIFSSTDCQDGGEDYLKKVEPGASETANFTWDRNRSAPGCAAVASNPNPGYYVFTAKLGEVTSETAVFELE
ncbi:MULTISPECIES: hypothetical protein [unclassified Arthrobacter]|uniref:hypothetical protein n=1 Tax=unclassified Arthrobacter TaxID=235627 RepID=UPI001D15B4EF|nr:MULTISPECIES: hypothetical protein [unclassified Arthrobacter]MCC3289451.1 hypothetical protein [Arthrobacter sp. zg-Y1110]MCC3301032.1 hypothetical protein [Arthrobacter sp. zg-Y895]UWX85108.1 hypothetical protein N2K99_00555 [Arthrobacter sp. zg-Y1110]